MSLVFDDKFPIYIQIINYLKKEIVRGAIKPGDKIASVRELASELKVNPNTVTRVFQELEREGITYTQRGMGTFIKEDEGMIPKLKNEMAQETVGSFVESMKKLGFTIDEVNEIVKDKWKDKEN